MYNFGPNFDGRSLTRPYRESCGREFRDINENSYQCADAGTKSKVFTMQNSSTNLRQWIESMGFENKIKYHLFGIFGLSVFQCKNQTHETSKRIPLHTEWILTEKFIELIEPEPVVTQNHEFERRDKFLRQHFLKFGACLKMMLGSKQKFFEKPLVYEKTHLYGTFMQKLKPPTTGKTEFSSQMKHVLITLSGICEPSKL